MLDRYRAVLALTSLCLLAASPGHHRHSRLAPRPNVAQPATGIELYSRRALRRARIIIQLKLMELHQEQLERVMRAVRRHVPIDELLKETRPSPRPSRSL